MKQIVTNTTNAGIFTIRFFLLAVLCVAFSSSVAFAKEISTTPSGLVEVSFYGVSDQNKLPYKYKVAAWPEKAKKGIMEAMQIMENTFEIDHKVSVGFIWTADLKKDNYLAAAYTNYIAIDNIAGLSQLDKNYKYPAELVHQLTGDSRYGSENITIIFNSTKDWCMNSDSEPEWFEQDLITVALHELTHGLGLSSSFTKSTESKPYIFDKFIRNNYGDQIAGSYSALKSSASVQLVGVDLYYEGKNGVKANNNEPIKLHVPETFCSASICHFDTKYTDDAKGRLMLPGTTYGVSTRFFGDFSCGVLQDIGWGVKIDSRSASVSETVESNIDLANVKVQSSNGSITVDLGGQERMEVSVYTISGRLVAKEMVYGTQTFTVASNNVYLVHVGGEVKKVLVK